MSSEIRDSSPAYWMGQIRANLAVSGLHDDGSEWTWHFIQSARRDLERRVDMPGYGIIRFTMYAGVFIFGVGWNEESRTIFVRYHHE